MCVPLQDPFPPCPDSFPSPIFLLLITTFPGITGLENIHLQQGNAVGVECRVSQCSPLSHQTAGGRKGAGAMEGRQSRKNPLSVLYWVPCKPPNTQIRGSLRSPWGGEWGTPLWADNHAPFASTSNLSPQGSSRDPMGASCSPIHRAPLSPECLGDTQPARGSVLCCRLPFFSSYYIVIISSLKPHTINQTAVLIIWTVDSHLAVPGRAGCCNLSPTALAQS